MLFRNQNYKYINVLNRYRGGGGGIRTHGTLSRTPVFKTGALNRSATPPHEARLWTFERDTLLAGGWQEQNHKNDPTANHGGVKPSLMQRMQQLSY